MSRHPSSYDRIYSVVKRIPKGRVATYGQIAELAGLGGHARQVGYALYALTGDTDVPWQRVINARGQLSPRQEPGGDRIQRAILEGEGVCFDGAGRIDLEVHCWKPRRQTTSGAKPRNGRQQT